MLTNTRRVQAVRITPARKLGRQMTAMLSATARVLLLGTAALVGAAVTWAYMVAIMVL